MTYIEM